MCSLKIQKTVINICNRAQRHCLWAKEEDSTSVNALAAWSLVCRPKQHGGLGVLNLELQNRALLMKQLHKFYSKADVPWVKLVWSLYGDSVPHTKSRRGSFWWRDIFSLADDYRSVSQCKVGSGTSVLFWKDFWVNGELLCDKFPRLFSYALDEDASVASLALADDRFSAFSLPLSAEAFEEFQHLSSILDATQIMSMATDRRVFVWGEKYSPARYYRFLFEQVPKDAALNAIWSSKALPKLKVFMWLLMLDRLNTRDIMLRKNWHVDSGPDCLLCTDAPLEFRDHLFFSCEFATLCWDFIHIHWDVTLPLSQRYMVAKSGFQGPCFMEVVACSAWNSWKVRNELVFNNIPASINRWKVGFQKDLLLHRFRVKAALVQPLIDWLLSIFV
jgi:hypothetical protein